MDDDAWEDVGLDDRLHYYCDHIGWSLSDVLDVLGVDDTSVNPTDWCYSGLGPLEAQAAIRDGCALNTAPVTRAKRTAP